MRWVFLSLLWKAEMISILIIQIWKLGHLYLWQSDSPNIIFRIQLAARRGQHWASRFRRFRKTQKDFRQKRFQFCDFAYQTRLVERKFAKSIFDAKITGWILQRLPKDFQIFFLVAVGTSLCAQWSCQANKPERAPLLEIVLVSHWDLKVANRSQTHNLRFPCVPHNRPKVYQSNFSVPQILRYRPDLNLALYGVKNTDMEWLFLARPANHFNRPSYFIFCLILHVALSKWNHWKFIF